MNEHARSDAVDLDGQPDLPRGRYPLSMVYGGGGVFGIGYGAGVATGLGDAGIPVRTAPALGTSAGSWVAAAVALGLGYDAFEDFESPPVPTLRPVVYESAKTIFATAVTTSSRHPQCSCAPVADTSLTAGDTRSPIWLLLRPRCRGYFLRTRSKAGATSTAACGRRPPSTLLSTRRR